MEHFDLFPGTSVSRILRARGWNWPRDSASDGNRHGVALQAKLLRIADERDSEQQSRERRTSKERSSRPGVAVMLWKTSWDGVLTGRGRRLGRSGSDLSFSEPLRIE